MSDENGPRLVVSEGRAVAAADAPPGLLDSIKDDLNIPLDDTTNDAWLQRRIDNVWARFEKYCCRALPVPPAQFVDDWGAIGESMVHHNQPFAIAPRGSPFLRYCPVVSVDAMTLNGTDVDPATNIIFEPASGKLFGVPQDAWMGSDPSFTLRNQRARITYTAGWTEIPGDLYEALLGCLMPLWQTRQAQQGGSGGISGAISRINVVDVGDIDIDTGGSFIEAATKGAARPGGNDPLIGPWITLLDSYVDVRVQMGSPLIPVTTPVPP